MTRTQAIKDGAVDLYGDGVYHKEVSHGVWVEVWVPKAVQDKRDADAAEAEATRLAAEAAV